MNIKATNQANLVEWGGRGENLQRNPLVWISSPLFLPSHDSDPKVSPLNQHPTCQSIFWFSKLLLPVGHPGCLSLLIFHAQSTPRSPAPLWARPSVLGINLRHSPTWSSVEEFLYFLVFSSFIKATPIFP